MKIISKGTWWAFTCSVCGSKWQAEPEDANSRPNIDRDGDQVGWIYTVECGKCGKAHDIPFNKVTDKIRRIADAKRKN